MNGWTVTLDLSVEPDPTDEELDELVDLLPADLAPIVSGGPGHDRIHVTLAIPDDLGPAAALQEAGSEVHNCIEKTWNVHARTVAAEVLTWDEHDRRLAAPAFPALVGVSEIADMLGVSRQRVSVLSRSEDFPEPVARLAAGPVWRAEDLSTFADGWHRQPGRPREP